MRPILVPKELERLGERMDGTISRRQDRTCQHLFPLAGQGRVTAERRPFLRPHIDAVAARAWRVRGQLQDSSTHQEFTMEEMVSS